MKKRYIIIIIICIVVILVGIISKNKVKQYIENEKMAKEWVDYLNCERKPFYISEKSFYNHCNHIYNTEYFEIDEAIEDYFKCLDKAMKKKIYNENKKFKEYFKSNQPLIHGLRDNTIEYISNLITEEDVADYNNKIFEDKIVKELEKVFEHRSKENYKEWYIKNDRNKTIELPYNVYIKYDYYDAKPTNEVERVQKIKINKDGKHCVIKYKATDGSIKEYKTDIIKHKYIDNDGNEIEYKLCYDGPLYVKYTQTADITFGQHDYDREKEEKEKAWAEVLKRRSEYKDIIHEFRIQLPQFEKYRANAHLLLHEFDDGSTAVKFYATKFIIKDGKNDVEYRDYYLPYENVKTKEEALEMYLADKEHYDADEAFLRENNRLYNGD